jgi:membrane-associated phospholipid phosphatase
MKEHYEIVKSNWNAKLTDSSFVFEFIFSLFLLISTMMIFSKFTTFVEMRKGFQFNDPLLERFQAIDLTKTIFVVLYGAICIALASLLASPYRLMILFQAYALMVMVRIVTLFILPLAPPVGMIFLQDPFVEFVGTSKTIDNNLFFSGHTATIFLLYLCVPPKLKFPFLLLTMFVAISVLLQKVHYTVDVLIAPCISFISYFLIVKFFKYRYRLKGATRLVV